MSPDSARRTVLNTDYPLDKVLETYEGSFIALARYGAFQPRRTDNPVPHSAGSFCLINGVYSIDNSTWYPFGVVEADTSGSLPSFQTVEVSAYCTDSHVVIQASNYLSSSSTIYYALQLIARE